MISMSSPEKRPSIFDGSETIEMLDKTYQLRKFVNAWYLLNGKLIPCILEALHFNFLALHFAFATLPEQDVQLPSQSGFFQEVVHPAVSIL